MRVILLVYYYPGKSLQNLKFILSVSMRALRIGISRNSKPKFTLLKGKFPYLLADYDI